MAIPDAHLLHTLGWAGSRIWVENNSSRRPAAMNAIDPLAAELGECREALLRPVPSRLETPHLAHDTAALEGALPPTTQRIAGS